LNNINNYKTNTKKIDAKRNSSPNLRKTAYEFGRNKTTVNSPSPMRPKINKKF